MIKNYFSVNGKIIAETSLFVDDRRGYPARIYKIVHVGSASIHARWINAPHNFEYIDTFRYSILNELTFPSFKVIKD